MAEPVKSYLSPRTKFGTPEADRSDGPNSEAVVRTQTRARPTVSTDSTIAGCRRAGQVCLLEQFEHDIH